MKTWTTSESASGACMACGARPVFVGTLAAFAMGLALGVMAMDMRYDSIMENVAIHRGCVR